VTLGNLTQPAAILALVGFVLIAALNYRKVLGGTIIGILVVAIIVNLADPVCVRFLARR
jgi:AGZA family xanthine/uracil permease-like MFS transporter